MKLSSLLLACSILFVGFSANAQIAHDLTVYSPDGLKFTFIANGEQINDEPESRIKMEDIEEDYLSVKVIFEDESIPPLEKKFLNLANPGTGPEGDKPTASVYTIIEKKGEYKFKFVSRSDKKVQEADVIIINNEQEDDADIEIKTPGVKIKIDKD